MLSVASAASVSARRGGADARPRNRWAAAAACCVEVGTSARDKSPRFGGYRARQRLRVRVLGAHRRIELPGLGWSGWRLGWYSLPNTS